MNTILVMLICFGRGACDWTPQYIAKYPTEAACQTSAFANKQPSEYTKKFVCVPEVKIDVEMLKDTK